MIIDSATGAEQGGSFALSLYEAFTISPFGDDLAPVIYKNRAAVRRAGFDFVHLTFMGTRMDPHERTISALEAGELPISCAQLEPDARPGLLLRSVVLKKVIARPLSRTAHHELQVAVR